MQTVLNSGDAGGRRRHYSAELKAEVVAQCERSGKSVAEVAAAHGVAAGRARSWVREARQSAAMVATQGQRAVEVSGFVPVQLAGAHGAANDIRIELVRGGSLSTRFGLVLLRRSAQPGCESCCDDQD